jgi:hypothetical protein
MRFFINIKWLSYFDRVKIPLKKLPDTIFEGGPSKRACQALKFLL